MVTVSMEGKDGKRKTATRTIYMQGRKTPRQVVDMIVEKVTK